MPSCFICSMSLPRDRCWRARARAPPAGPRGRRSRGRADHRLLVLVSSSTLALPFPRSHPHRAAGARREHSPRSTRRGKCPGLPPLPLGRSTACQAIRVPNARVISGTGWVRWCTGGGVVQGAAAGGDRRHRDQGPGTPRSLPKVLGTLTRPAGHQGASQPALRRGALVISGGQHGGDPAQFPFGHGLRSAARGRPGRRKCSDRCTTASARPWSSPRTRRCRLSPRHPCPGDPVPVGPLGAPLFGQQCYQVGPVRSLGIEGTTSPSARILGLDPDVRREDLAPDDEQRGVTVDNGVRGQLGGDQDAVIGLGFALEVSAEITAHPGYLFRLAR